MGRLQVDVEERRREGSKLLERRYTFGKFLEKL